MGEIEDKQQVGRCKPDRVNNYNKGLDRGLASCGPQAKSGLPSVLVHKLRIVFTFPNDLKESKRRVIFHDT